MVASYTAFGAGQLRMANASQFVPRANGWTKACAGLSCLLMHSAALPILAFSRVLGGISVAWQLHT